MVERIDIAELDCIYLSYDEPNADEFWAKIQANVPWAKRVHGVKGSDAAHKAAAVASDTERFVLIDGDNLPDWQFFNEQLILDDRNKNKVFRWRARNAVNGLSYGNGGLSCWTKRFVEEMRTHENTDGSSETEVEFCFDEDYWAMHDIWSTTYPNQSPMHAWRAGFREGVKLCLDRGRRVDPEDFEKDTWIGNRNNLIIWCSVGADAKHGSYSMLGARIGAKMCVFDDDWDHRDVQDFDKLKSLWDSMDSNTFPEGVFQNVSVPLRQRLGLDIVDLNAQASRFFKDNQPKYQNVDIMLRETDWQRTLREAARQLRR
jgi:hypothetical protein